MPRLALCSNVFPWEDLATLLAAFEQGPLPQLAQRLGGRPPGFGVYLPARTAYALRDDAELRATWLQRWRAAGWPIWTANAFPYGGFHAARVKEKAFLPDWSSSERLAYTCAVADLMAELMPAGSRGSISTCPLGYGPAPLSDPSCRRHLVAAEEHLRGLAVASEVYLTLALEAEPDGALERTAELARWLAAPGDPTEHLGVCWDLCHSAVVGESSAEVLQALTQTGVRCAKVQISAALLVRPQGGRLPTILDALAQDPWFHQVRGRDADGEALAWSDLPPALADPAAAAAAELRIHCHVPVHRSVFAEGVVGTPWREALADAVAAGIEDFELETYTLPVLPAALLEREGLVGTLAAELRACSTALGLDSAERLS